MDNFQNKIWPQNCGDDLKVISKSDKRDYWICEFTKYPYRKEAKKYHIVNGSVLNPLIEENKYIGKEFLQKCGDILKIIEKTDKKAKDNSFLYRCQFQKYPYEVFISDKRKIEQGQILNPQIEQVEFIDKIWSQNCGDSLKVIEKTEPRKWKCKFIKYPYEVICEKSKIIIGEVLNPQIEQVEFIDKIWHQNCGDDLRVIRKTNKKDNTHNYLFECEFLKYPNKILVQKRYIIEGSVYNNELPWCSKENLIKYIQKNFKEKPTLNKVAKSLNLADCTLGHKINEFGLRDYISYSYLGKETELKEYIESLLNTQLNSYNDKNYEIDIYIPNKNLGFEFNGDYWHSSLYKENNYHQEKSLYFQNKNINLIHIWEWEWMHKQEILKFLIKSKLGLFNKKVGASKCKIKELDYRTYADFCNENHLQGECGARVKLGLFYQDELVQIMSFGSPRFTLDFDWEIIRECSKLGYIIIGGKEKLWSYFVKNYFPKNCISYCDFSKFTGNSYLKLGFKKERLNKPGFVWYDEKTKEIFWRDPFHHKEMKDKDYLKIYDCGQLVFVWNKI